jgi:coenzyme F420-reducing hydrogenase alpha subunit
VINAMSKKMVFHPITRIEGHSKVTLVLNDDKIENAYFQVTEYRGFEKLLINRPIEEAPLIVPRICGLCSPSHHLASVKALDEIFGVIPKENIIRLRELLHYAGFLHSHLLHFFILYLPDILFSDIKPNPGFVGMIKSYPSLIKDVLEIRGFAQQILEILGGSSIHPSATMAGTFLNPLKPSQQTELRDKASKSIKLFNIIVETIEDKLSKILENSINLPSNFVSLHSKSGYPLYHSDEIHAISPKGELLTSFQHNDYLKVICEKAVSWSYAKAPYLKIIDNGYYRVGPLARFNINGKFYSENSEIFAQQFLYNVPSPICASEYYNIVRIAEIKYVLDKILEILDDKRIMESVYLQKNLKPMNSDGIGIIEAPRGLLIHHYKVDDYGYIKYANLIVATVQNTPVIESEIVARSQQVIDKYGVSEERLYDTISRMIRSYDPCLSCATHTSSIPFTLEIYIKNENKVLLYPAAPNTP